MTPSNSAGARFRAAVQAESPLQVMGAITAYAGMMAKRTGYQALYLSGGGVAANSLGVPDLGISTMEDVLTDARRIVDATGLPLLVDIDTGWGGAFNIGRAIRNFERIGVAAVHMEDQVGTLQTRAELYDFLGYHAYEDKLDQLFAQDKKED
jgi:methylisocitrate lyase